MLTATDGWAVGWAPDGSASTREVTLTEHWNGSQWSVVSSPNPPGFWQQELHAVSADSPADAWAVGDSINSTTNGSDQTLVEHWNGSQWATVSTPIFTPGFGHLDGVKAFAPNDVWAVGSYATTTGDDPELTLVLHWDGSSWTQISTPNPNSLSNRLLAITATSPSDIWAGGLLGRNTNFQPLALHWNGSSWSTHILPDIQTEITALAALPSTTGASSDVWAVGYAYGSMPGYLDGFCSHWDGSTWTDFTCGSALGPMYSVSAVASNFVWAVGGQGTPTINSWDGFRWNPVSTSQVHASIIYGVSGMTSSTAFAVGAQLTSDPSQSVKTAAEVYSIP